MAIVQVPWDAQLVSLRRQVCPQAMWDSAHGAWLMTADDAETFLNAAQARMFFCRSSCTLTIDGTVWVIGFKRGAPYPLTIHQPFAP
jgi:hypothetical protein